MCLTGTFWDDWCIKMPKAASLSQSQNMGEPWRDIFVDFAQLFPGDGYRILVFLVFLSTAILLYLILRKIPFFNEEGAFWISLLYTVIPVNDARVMLCVFSYSCTLLIFLVGFYLFLFFLEYQNAIWYKKLIIRVFTLVLFFVSYITNSFLVFYFTVIVYLLYIEYSSVIGTSKIHYRFFKALWNVLKSYPDFVALPFIFFFGKNILYPRSGSFSTYNKVYIKSIIITAIKIIPETFYQFIKVCKEFFAFFSSEDRIRTCAVATFFIAKVAVFFLEHKSSLRDNELKSFFKSKKEQLIILVIGLIVLAMSIFPYAVIRDIRSMSLWTDGVGGRDSLLLPFGIAMIIFAILKVLYNNSKVTNIALILVLAFGALSMNVKYLDYQKDAYWQEALVFKLEENEDISKDKNILFLSDDDNGIDGTRFYSLNGDGATAFNNQSRLFMNGFNDLRLITTDVLETYRESFNTITADYDYSYDKLDSVIIFDCNLRYRQVLDLKWLEIFDRAEYEHKIENLGLLEYYSADSNEVQQMLEGYEY